MWPFKLLTRGIIINYKEPERRFFMKARKILAMMMALSVAASNVPVTSRAADTTEAISFTFSDEGITVD